jgi:hypothetical protein
MRSVLIALFTLGLVSWSTPAATEPSAQTAKQPSMEHDLGQGWRLWIYGSPPMLCSMMKITNAWGLTLVRYHSDKPYVLQITNYSWFIPGPSPIKFEFKFGDEIPWDQMGKSVNMKTVQTTVGKEFIYRWKAHRMLKIKINGSEINFDLLGTSNATKVLEQCSSGLSTSEPCGADCL